VWKTEFREAKQTQKEGCLVWVFIVKHSNSMANIYSPCLLHCLPHWGKWTAVWGDRKQEPNTFRETFKTRQDERLY